MATAKSIVAGLGARYGVAYVLDSSTGLPLPSAPSVSPYTGIQIEGIKEYTLTGVEPQVFNHYGDDRVFATDQLSPTETPSLTVTTGKDNQTLDAALSGSTEVSRGGDVRFLAAETNKKGQEPQVALWFFRQALDAGKGSATLGSLRQYNARGVNSSRVTYQPTGGAQTNVDQTYNATVTPTSRTFWGETFTNGTWGVTEAAIVRSQLNAPGIWNFWRGTATIGSFSLSHAPIAGDSGALKVWIDGSLTVPGSINYSSPAFSLTAIPTGVTGSLIAALIQTNDTI